MDIEEAFREYRESMVRAMVSFSADQEAAEDGVSHAFAQASANKLMLEAMPEPAMKAWLFAAARNAVIDIKRREIRFLPIAGENSDFDFADSQQVDPAEKAAAELLLGELLAALPESLRVPVELKFYSGMNASEIGEVMKLPAATVRTRLHTAMLRLRKNYSYGGN